MKVYEPKEAIYNSNEAYKLLLPYYSDIQENVNLMVLNQANKVLVIFNDIFKGGLNNCMIDIPTLFRHILMTNGDNFILCHSHPSGNEKPSIQDIELTKKIKEACSIVCLNMLDHIIITKNNYYSFKDDNYL